MPVLSQQKQGQKGFLLFNLLKKVIKIIYVNATRWFLN